MEIITNYKTKTVKAIITKELSRDGEKLKSELENLLQLTRKNCFEKVILDLSLSLINSFSIGKIISFLRKLNELEKRPVMTILANEKIYNLLKRLGLDKLLTISKKQSN